MISTKIRQERRNLKLTQAELSKMLNISQSTLAGYETGTREPDINTIIKFAKIFNCTIDYLVGLEKREIPTLNNKQLEIVDLTLNLNDIELIKTKAYIQGLIDNRINKSQTNIKFDKGENNGY